FVASSRRHTRWPRDWSSDVCSSDLGDEYVIDGNKVFTSGANQADFIWLACRTDPDAPKHKGISMIVVPTSSPGFSFTPIVTVGEIGSAACRERVQILVGGQACKQQE